MSDIRGVGIDLCSISRMQEHLSHEHFMHRCFTPVELDYIQSKGDMVAASAAGIWAAKEAILKAFSCGITIPLTDICILHRSSGQPYASLSAQAADLLCGGQLHISISHESDLATAYCVWTT